MPPWSHATTEELLGLAVDALAAGDRRGLTLLGDVLTRECGAQFAATVTSALDSGAPLDAFDFLPAPSAAAPIHAAPEGAVVHAEAPDAPVPGKQSSADPETDRARTAPETASAPPAPEMDPVPPAPETAPGHAPSHHRRLAPGVPPPLPDSGYVTALEVAAHFGVSVKAVYRWMSTGRIRAERRPGGSYRIPADQFRS